MDCFQLWLENNETWYIFTYENPYKEYNNDIWGEKKHSIDSGLGASNPQSGSQYKTGI